MENKKVRLINFLKLEWDSNLILYYVGIMFWLSSNFKRLKHHSERLNEKETESFFFQVIACVQNYQTQGFFFFSYIYLSINLLT